MKRTVILMVVLFAVAMSQAQSPADELFDKYAGKEGFTTVYISKYMFDLFSNIESTDPGAKEMTDAISNLTGIKILATEKPDININFYNEIKKKISAGGYKELMTVKEEGQDVQFLVRENGNKVSELLLIVSGKGENVLMSIQGDIDMKNISKLAGAMDIEGMEKLEKIDKQLNSLKSRLLHPAFVTVADFNLVPEVYTVDNFHFGSFMQNKQVGTIFIR